MIVDTRTAAAPKPKARGNRTSALEIARRKHAVAKIIIAGVDDTDLVAYCRDKWGVCDDTARSYISAANDELRRAFAHDAKREAQKALLRYESLFRACRQSGDLRAAATMQDRICKLLRLWDDGVIRHEAGDSLTQLLQAIRRTGAAG